MEEKAARAYDLAALKYWGPSTHINFSVRFFPLISYDFLSNSFQDLKFLNPNFS